MICFTFSKNENPMNNPKFPPTIPTKSTSLYTIYSSWTFISFVTRTIANLISFFVFQPLYVFVWPLNSVVLQGFWQLWLRLDNFSHAMPNLKLTFSKVSVQNWNFFVTLLSSTTDFISIGIHFVSSYSWRSLRRRIHSMTEFFY